MADDRQVLVSTPTASDPATWHRVGYTTVYGYGKHVVVRTETALVTAWDTAEEAEAQAERLRKVCSAEPFACLNCGKPMAEHDAMARCKNVFVVCDQGRRNWHSGTPHQQNDDCINPRKVV